MTRSDTRTKVTCSCGHAFYIQGRKEWCAQCGRPVFKNPKDNARHRRSTYFFTLMLLAGIGLAVYFFMEMIVANIGP
jgi:hypothetical protein